ncbi:MAG: VOC family protein [Deltaproteobacteria bacterium]|nr:VOC family protein [Deltaproteobacteria bacterium]
MERRTNKEFELRGVNHLALVCKDMARTVDFYSKTLGMPLTKTIELPNSMGQHFFFDIGNKDSLAFFWFPDAPDAAPGIASPKNNVGQGSLATAHGSMNHVAFDVSAEKLSEYRDRLRAKGVEVTEVIHHDDTPRQVSPTVNDSTFVSSIYFFDPDGILLEFAGWTREFGEGDVRHQAATAEDKERYLATSAAVGR